MTTFPLRLTEELKAIASAQAARAGVSLNQYIATVLAAHVRAQAEAERMFAARAARGRPGTARAILAQAGKRRRPRVRIGWMLNELRLAGTASRLCLHAGTSFEHRFRWWSLILIRFLLV
jgi:hypothetical protein